MSKKIKVMLLVVLFVVVVGGVGYSVGGDSLKGLLLRAPVVRSLSRDKVVRLSKDDVLKKVKEVSVLRGELFEEDEKGDLQLIASRPTKEDMKKLKDYTDDLKTFRNEYLAVMKSFNEDFKGARFMDMSDGGDKGDWYDSDDAEDPGSYTSEPEPEDPEPPALNPADYYDEDGVFNFLAYVQAYVDLFLYKPEDYDGNYVWVFPFHYVSYDIDTDILSPENPHVASNFVACTIGDEPSFVNSVAFDLKGATGGKVEFVVNSGTSHDGPLEILDHSVKTWVNNWPGDINFPDQTPVILDPGECVGFGLQYLDTYPEQWDPQYFPSWGQFSLRGLGSTLPVYFIGDGVELSALEDSNVLRGSINVFEYLDAILLEGNPYNLQYDVEGPDVSYAWLGSFDAKTTPNSKATVENLVFDFENTYDEAFDVSISAHYRKDKKFHIDDDSYFVSKDFTLEPGLNTVDLGFELGYAERASFNINLIEPPTSEGSMTLSLVDVGSDADKYEGGDAYYPSYNEPFDGLELNTVDFQAAVSEGAPYIRASWYPYSNWNSIEWYSEDDFDSAEILANPTISWVMFEHSNQADEGILPIDIDPFVFDIYGYFENPISVTLYSEGATYNEELGYNEWDGVEIGQYDVLPGSSVYVDPDPIYSSNSRSYALIVDEFPYEPNEDSALVKVKINNEFEATLTDPDVPDFIDGVPADVYVYDHLANYYVANFIYPMVYRMVGFAPILVYKDVDYNSSVETVILSQWEDSESYTMNNVCMHAQGGVVIKGFTYRHDTRYDSPYEAVTLNTGDNIIYLDFDSEWTEELATFHLTNPVTFDSQDFCLSLEVALPTTDVEDAWFDLIGIDAVDGEGVSVSVYETYQPPNNALLGTNNPIDGPVVSFLDF